MPDQNEQNYEDSLKIPLVVGVTGHIDILTPEDEIKKQMECFWERIQKAAGPETPIILLSSIAKGADHLMVKYRPKGMKYCVVLPFDKHEYRKDFETETALAEFEADLKGAYKVIDCHAQPKDYTLASDYVRKHSDVLLTLWDGYENLNPQTNKPEWGGTYYQIREAFGLDDLLIHHQEKTHLIVNLPVKRAKDHAARRDKLCPGFPREEELMVIEFEEDKAGERKLVFTSFSKYDFGNDSAKSEPGFFAKILKSLCDFSSARPEPEADQTASFARVLGFLRRHNENLSSNVPQNPNYLRGKLKDHSVAMKIVNEDFNRHEYFDHLAQSHQTPHKKQFFRIAVCSVIVGVLGQAWGDLTFAADKVLHEWIMHIVILLYLLGCAGVFYLGGKIAREDHYTKYLNPRIIAELLRLKIFWTLAGIRESFMDYIFDESASYEFMVPICNWEIADKPFPESDREWLDKGNGFAAVKKGWLEDQIAYYQKFHIYNRRDRYVKLAKTFFAWCGFILAILLFVVFVLAQVFKFDHTKVWRLSWYREFMVGICPFAVATLGWLLEKNNWDSLSRQYQKILNRFQRASDFVGDGSQDVEDKRQMIRELVKSAHEENAEWQDIRKNARPEPMV